MQSLCKTLFSADCNLTVSSVTQHYMSEFQATLLLKTSIVKAYKSALQGPGPVS
jgi:hypothetical protein